MLCKILQKLIKKFNCFVTGGIVENTKTLKQWKEEPAIHKLTDENWAWRERILHEQFPHTHPHQIKLTSLRYGIKGKL